MDGHIVFLVIWGLAMVGMFGYWLRSLARNGRKGMVFQAPVVEKVGELEVPSFLGLRPKLEVYRLDGGSDRAVGLKVKLGFFANLAFSISKDHAEALNRLLIAETAER